jgi:hypothetical protein
MRGIKTVFAWLGVWALLICLVGAVSAQDVFLDSMSPTGIGVDASGNVFIHSVGVSTTLLTKMTSDGNELLQTPLGNPPVDYLRFLYSHLAIDPNPQVDRLYLLSPEGDLVSFDADTLAEIGRFNILDLDIDTEHAFDVATSNATGTFSLSPFSTFGDIAAFRPNSGSNAAAWFVTGISNGLAFVMRIPMQNSSYEGSGAQVLLVSTLASPSTLNWPRGVATINGSAVTTLPLSTSNSSCPDVVIRFSATASSLSQNDVSDLSGTAGVPSWGMTTSAQGIYLVAGGANANCLQGDRGFLAFIPSSLTGIEGTVSLPSFANGRPGDVSVGSNSGFAYVTVTDYNTVLRFSLTSVASLPLP